MRWGKPEKAPERAKTTLVAKDIVTDSAALRWGTVSTIKAPVQQIARFIAYHLDAGAAQMDIFLDVPDPAIAQQLQHPKVRFHQCDDAFWADKPAKARESHQLRQASNATQAYKTSDLDWLAHIDVDEYILSDQPLARHLSRVPADMAFARMQPVELMASDDPWTGPAYFKRTRKAVKGKTADLIDIYPTFGAYVPEGFISYTGGKNIVRTGFRRIRLGIHAMMHAGAKVSNGQMLETVHVGHAHAPDWDTFQRHFDFRMTHGSYRKKTNGNMILNDVLKVLIEEEGDSGLRRFYDEMCAATPERLDLLRKHDMLVTAPLDLDDKVARIFGSQEPVT